LRWLRRSALRSPGAASQIASVSSCISRKAAKPIISRKKQASEDFSKSEESTILSSVIEVVPWVRTVIRNPILPKITAVAAKRPTPPAGTLPTIASAPRSCRYYSTKTAADHLRHQITRPATMQPTSDRYRRAK